MKEYNDFFNPYNGYKCLVYTKEWKEMMKTGEILPPVSVSVDLSNKCQLNCEYCNSKKAIQSNEIMSNEKVDIITDLSKKKFFQSLCVAGGGEPLFSNNFKRLVNNIDKACSIGVITNGINIKKYISELLKCKWVGISVDSGTSDVYTKLKGADCFDRVIGNIKYLIKMGHSDVTYKYLIWPSNIKDIYTVAKIARDIGVHNFHCRPAGRPWYDLSRTPLFTEENVDNINMQIEKCHSLGSNEFKVYTMVQKFGKELEKSNDFKKCWAALTTCVVYPNGQVGLCCDRRGDETMTLCTLDNIEEIWGSEYHKQRVRDINLAKCPRCTYKLINQVFERIIFKDEMYCEFI